MDNADIGPVADAMPGVPDAAAQIHLFVVKEEVLIEVANLIEYTSANDREGTPN